MYHALTAGFLLLSVLQIAAVYSRAVWDGCFGETRGKCQAEATELWQSVIQPSKELSIIGIIGSISSISTSGSDCASNSRNTPSRIRHHTQERYNTQGYDTVTWNWLSEFDQSGYAYAWDFFLQQICIKDPKSDSTWITFSLSFCPLKSILLLTQNIVQPL